MTYKYFSLLAFAFLLFGLAFIVIHWPQNKSMTFSQHVAKHKNAILFYIFLFAVGLTLLLLFFFQWFIPTFNVPWVFGFLITISAVTQFLCTLIPETGGLKSNCHRVLAGTSAVLLIPALATLLITVSLSAISKSVVILSFLTMAFIIYLVVKNRGSHKYFLVLQSVYFLVFFISIFVISY